MTEVTKTKVFKCYKCDDESYSSIPCILTIDMVSDATIFNKRRCIVSDTDIARWKEYK